MATPQQRAQVVVWYAETKWFITVQQNYRQVYGGDAPDTKTIKAWFDKFLATRSVLKQSGGTRRVFPKRKSKKFSLRSRDWTRQTNLLAPAFTGYQSAWFLFLGVRQRPSVCSPCAWSSNVTRPHPWCDWFSNPGHVGQNMARNWVDTDLTLFVPPVGHMLKCTELTVAQILWVPLSYTANCINLAFTVFSQWWTEMWEVWKGHSVHLKR
jgi:hypothetical protein